MILWRYYMDYNFIPDSDRVVVKCYKYNLSNWLPFGKYMVNRNMLLKNRLNVKLSKSLSAVSHKELRHSRDISKGFVDFIMDVIENKERFDMSLFFSLNDIERKTAMVLMDKSGYGKTIGFNWLDAYRDRFKVLQGLIGVGNTNPELVKEAIDVVKKLIAYHAISYRTGQDMLHELEEVIAEENISP